MAVERDGPVQVGAAWQYSAIVTSPRRLTPSSWWGTVTGRAVREVLAEAREAARGRLAAGAPRAERRGVGAGGERRLQQQFRMGGGGEAVVFGHDGRGEHGAVADTVVGDEGVHRRTPTAPSTL